MTGQGRTRFRGRSSRFPVSVVLACALTVVFAPTASAQAGTLDTGFDGDGKVTTNFTPGLDFGYDVAVQIDGKIVVVGLAVPQLFDKDRADRRTARQDDRAV